MRLFAYKTGCSKSTYLTSIGFVDYTKNLQSSVFVSCSCDYFKYNYEYAMATRGASDHIYAWRQPPVEKNPSMLPGCCKHVLAILDDALRRTRQFAKLDKNKDLDIDDTDIDSIPDDRPRRPGPELNRLPNQRSDNPADNPSDAPKSPVPQVYRRQQPAQPDQKTNQPQNEMHRLPGTPEEEK
jgi:hypothetical protein